jgi:hypothetical protein
MMIIINEPSQQVIVQKMLFDTGHRWFNSGTEIQCFNFENFLCYIVDETQKCITYFNDLDLDYYIINYNDGFEPINANIYLREEKLKRILYENI